jgi:hypothetical protein
MTPKNIRLRNPLRNLFPSGKTFSDFAKRFLKVLEQSPGLLPSSDRYELQLISRCRRFGNRYPKVSRKRTPHSIRSAEFKFLAKRYGSTIRITLGR